MHIDNVIFLILSKNAYTKFSAGPVGNLIFDFFYSFCMSSHKSSGTEDPSLALGTVTGCCKYQVILTPYQKDTTPMGGEETIGLDSITVATSF